MQARYGRMIMCHMIADTSKELLAMMDKIGIKRRWLQHGGAWREHVDVCLSKRARAIEHGAVLITRREYAALVTARREPATE
jgi:hypothetical protein